MLPSDHGRRSPTWPTSREEDPAVYDMLCKADSVGVFQVESRAQMSMLPRLKPREFYDLVIEVAIVRPGPIQGDMVHPYLRRRDGLEPVSFPAPSPEHGPSDELKHVLGKTLGVPLFQEQAMRLAMEAAKFTPRRGQRPAPRHGHLPQPTARSATTGRSSSRAWCGAATTPSSPQRCFKQIEGFGSYGFPGEPRGQLRQAGLRLGLDQMPPPGRVLRRPAQQPAHGLLPAGPAGPRRPRARRRGARRPT